MRILKWKRLVPVILVGLCCGSALRASPFADDDGKDKAPDKRAAGAKIDAPVSGLAQTASGNADSTGLEAASSEKNAGSPAALAAGRESSADEKTVSEAEQSPARQRGVGNEPGTEAAGPACTVGWNLPGI
jgi:hypothetical protein